MFLSKSARELGKAMADITSDVAEGMVPLEALYAFRANPWAVLDDRTVVTTRREGILDKRLDMATLGITSLGKPFGFLQDGRLWFDGAIESDGSVKDRCYVIKDAGRTIDGVFLDGQNIVTLGGGWSPQAIFPSWCSMVTADDKGCVLSLKSGTKHVLRVPDGKVMTIDRPFDIEGAITDPVKPMCIWGRGEDHWCWAFVLLANDGRKDSTLRVGLAEGETVCDVAVFGVNVALEVKDASGKYALRVACANPSVETRENGDRTSPIENLVWLNERILLGRLDGKLFAKDLRMCDIAMELFEGEVVQGPVRHPDGRVMAIMRRPVNDGRHELVVFHPDRGIEMGGHYSLVPSFYQNVKAILGGSYVLRHPWRDIPGVDVSPRVAIAILRGDDMKHVLDRENVELESFVVDGEGFRAVLSLDGDQRSLVYYELTDEQFRIRVFSGAYRQIDLASAIVADDRLIARVQTVDGHWVVADQGGELGDASYGIFGLRVVQDGANHFIKWTTRHRRELVDCMCKAF